MERLNVGDHVTILYGREQGLKATIMKSLPGDSYKVRVENGYICYYSSKGLTLEDKKKSKLVG